MRSWRILSGPCGSSGSTTIWVCMNRIGAPSCSLSGSVDEVIGASFSPISATLTEAGIGPTPEEPVIVT